MKQRKSKKNPGKNPTILNEMSIILKYEYGCCDTIENCMCSRIF